MLKLKSVISFVLLAFMFAGNVFGQTNFEQAQARVIEPKQDVFIKPLVADIEIMEDQKRQDYGPYEYPIQSIDNLTNIQLENLKRLALHDAAVKEAKADVIVAATFKIATGAKGKSIIIELSGFPGKYVNFRPASKEDGDYEWITTVYPYADRVAETGKTKAIEN